MLILTHKSQNINPQFHRHWHYVHFKSAALSQFVVSVTVEGWPDNELSFVLTLPSLKCLCHHWTILLSSVLHFHKPLSTKHEWWELYCLAKFDAHCLDFVMWGEDFSASSLDNSDVLFVTVQTIHCWSRKPDSNPYSYLTT